MSIGPEELAAFADGELSGDQEERVAAAVEADPKLAAKVDTHRQLQTRLAGHFAPILTETVPERLSGMLDKNHHDPELTGVADFAAAKQRREAARRLPGWGWAGTAIAASLVVALVWTTRTEQDAAGEYAGLQLASTLDSQMVASQPTNAETRILLSFRNSSSEFCRAYTGSETSGIACRDDEGWRLDAIGDGNSVQNTEFRMANSTELLEQAQEMAAGPPLTAAEEAAALKAGWRN